jgi:hypothetical protein
VLYMVIERFVRGPLPVYERAAEKGRMMPEGLHYVRSWVDSRDLSTCFQLMEVDDESLFAEWMSRWDDLVEFQVVPVISSEEASTRAVTSRASAS